MTEKVIIIGIRMGINLSIQLSGTTLHEFQYFFFVEIVPDEPSGQKQSGGILSPIHLR